MVKAKDVGWKEKSLLGCLADGGCALSEACFVSEVRVALFFGGRKRTLEMGRGRKVYILQRDIGHARLRTNVLRAFYECRRWVFFLKNLGTKVNEWKDAGGIEVVGRKDRASNIFVVL